MSNEGRAILKGAQEKYLQVLSDLVTARFGVGSEWAPESVRRMNQLLMMLTRVEVDGTNKPEREMSLKNKSEFRFRPAGIGLVCTQNLFKMVD